MRVYHGAPFKYYRRIIIGNKHSCLILLVCVSHRICHVFATRERGRHLTMLVRVMATRSLGSKCTGIA